MHRKRPSTFRVLWALLAGLMVLSSHAHARDYVVRRGDTASAIALRELGLPVWAVGGSLDKLLAANPRLKNPDRIWPGMKLHVAPEPATRKISSAPEPSPPKLPDAVPAPTAQREFPFSRVGAALRFDFFRIDSEDRSSGTTATFLSNLSPSFEGEWGLRWSRDWESLVQVGYRKEEILSPTDTSKTVSGGSVARYRAGVGAVRHWLSGDRTSLVLSRESFLFARALSATAVQIDPVETEALTLGHRHALVTVGSAELGVEGNAALRAPAAGFGYRVQTGWGALGGAYLAHELSSVTLGAEAYFQYSSQGSTLVKQTQKNLGLSFGVSWSLR